MKSFSSLLLAFVAASSAFAQISPVQMNVQPFNNRKDAGPAVPGGPPAATGGQPALGRYLRISVRNIGANPLSEVTVRWGIMRSMRTYTSTSTALYQQRTFPVAFGGQETFDLKPRQEKVIETGFLEAKRSARVTEGYRDQEKIEGHGVQVFIGGRVVAEEFVGAPACKQSMDELHPIASANDEDNERDRKRPVIPRPALATVTPPSAPPSAPFGARQLAAPRPAGTMLRYDGLYATAEPKDITMRSKYRYANNTRDAKVRTYFRYYQDGTVIQVRVSGSDALEEQCRSVAKWFTRNHRAAEKGRYTSTGAKIEMAIRKDKYEGEIREDGLALKSGQVWLQFVHIGMMP
ncbi:MAG: hypothetical protein FJ388_01790 [Verrucomicrobia bacterium]|nr:hypothetical protein [Verrucomicrobiota bacterium]